MQFKQRRELKRTKIEIIPMIDTIFFLLVFFMLSSLSLVHLNGLPVNLPQASTGTHQQAQDVTITIDVHQRIFVNQQMTTLVGLGSLIKEKAGGSGVDIGTATVLINADRTVPHGLVVNCMDTARSIGVIHFGILTMEAAPDGR